MGSGGQEEVFFGIDFGTTNRTIAMLQPGKELQLARFSFGGEEMPACASVLYFEQSKSASGQRREHDPCILAGPWRLFDGLWALSQRRGHAGKPDADPDGVGGPRDQVVKCGDVGVCIYGGLLSDALCSNGCRYSAWCAGKKSLADFRRPGLFARRVSQHLLHGRARSVLRTCR